MTESKKKNLEKIEAYGFVHVNSRFGGLEIYVKKAENLELMCLYDLSRDRISHIFESDRECTLEYMEKMNLLSVNYSELRPKI